MKTVDETIRNKMEFWFSGFLMVCLAAAISFALHEAGLLERMDFFNLDWLMAAKTPVRAPDVFLVIIDDNDYKNLFAATSPLPPEKLVEIINLVARSQPKVIGVDIETSHWSAEVRNKVQLNGTPIVWAVQPEILERSSLKSELLLPSLDQHQTWALPGLFPDRDGFVRRYYVRIPAELPLKEDYEGTTFRSFPSTVYASMAPEGQTTSNEPEDLSAEGSFRQSDLRRLINFTATSFDSYRASDLIALANHPVINPREPLFPEMQGRAVLIGGTYAAGRDRYPTLAGGMSGIELLGHAILTERFPIREASAWDLVRADLLFGLVLLVINYFFLTRLPSTFQKLVSILLEFLFLPLLSLLLSWLAFAIWRFYASFLILSCGIFIHALLSAQYEQRTKLRDLSDEIEELSKTVHELRTGDSSISSKP